MMAMGWKAVVLCLFAYTLRMAYSQRNIYGPNFCLLSRLEVVPCMNVFPSTPDPGVNEYSVYQTRYARGPAGLPICIVNEPPQDHIPIRPIESIGRDGQVKFIVSPGIELRDPQLYGNQQLVNYSIGCPDGHIAFFNVTFADLEEPNCAAGCQAMQNCPPRCVDYLEVNRGAYGVTESCGNDTTRNSNQFELGSFSAIFRTSRSKQHRGFKATIVCFRDEDEPPAGCTMPTETGKAMMTTSGEDQRRRKRDLEEFHNQWRWHLTYLKRMKRQTQNFNIRFRMINVGHQVVVTFANKVLTFTDIQTNSTTESIDNVLFLHTFDAEGKLDEFRENGLTDKGRLIPFPGPGPMFIVGRHAYFQLFVIDPRGLVPNENETIVLNILTEGQFDALVLEDTPLSKDFLLPPTLSPVDIGLPPGLRRRRQAEVGEQVVGFSDSVLLIAIQNENACNPVVRANSLATIQSANSTDVARLRNMLTDSGSGMLGTTEPLNP